ncbi:MULTISPECIES: TetR/AcrR family transcriptional regulator [unclassified Mucilaginibacter]|uniref:TetR/AcrR family transcriptional regulator n=1 Tax=unclassified Mucilaginibacter TaxID=2617802 RepID=UPI00095C9861|nr:MULTISPECIES: TetR/AcrR family transcriptional regulator [unclassified Mucilaginibacter]OJW15917.1 MAG: TetR family transcriptional regulator [Mucilaginibacter sp. 44-25]PLW90517.1 MAG: TetR family transcriptional regulator [Mucilaginibacter sp.]PMP64563.1 MAG: TetR family transcriptional regulator [Mucilaginibacter sp.]HEK21666.1 TetR/AcrR family transcriptional regulator [Bacteroidota bacterium]
MASKDRIARLKEETRINILKAAFDIVKTEGWQALSMRKIADAIEYTAPIIYEYFANKEAIILELTRQGYLKLSQKLQEAKDKHSSPAKQLEEMWLTYWNFAFANKELYQIMFGINASCSCEMVNKLPEAECPWDIIADSIGKLMKIEDMESEVICTKYYTFWSVVHGLVSINLVDRGNSDEVNKQVLRDAITGIIRSITP